jgi:hypothetical protein
MPLTPQEQHCIDLALGALGDLYGGTWRVPDGPTLDDLHKSQASPECLVTNDLISAAVEVKRLTGDSVMQAYREALMSLNRSLTPSCGGYYTLSPAVDFRLPIDGWLRRHLKEEIERVAPALVPGGAPGAVHIPRKAHVSMSREDGPGYLTCCHNSTRNLVAAASPLVTGTFLLVDQGMLEHSFVTCAGLAAFHAALADACRRRVETGSGHFEWFEEWELWRCEDSPDDDPRDRDGVHVICVTEARSVEASVAEALDLMLEKALKKFERTWAERHVIVFDQARVLCNAERAGQALSWVTPDELANVDLILLTHNDEVSVLWKKRASPQRLVHDSPEP